MERLLFVSFLVTMAADETVARVVLVAFVVAAVELNARLAIPVAALSLPGLVPAVPDAKPFAGYVDVLVQAW